MEIFHSILQQIYTQHEREGGRERMLIWGGFGGDLEQGSSCGYGNWNRLDLWGWGFQVLERSSTKRHTSLDRSSEWRWCAFSIQSAPGSCWWTQSWASSSSLISDSLSLSLSFCMVLLLLMGMVRPLPISNSLSAWFCVHDDGHPSTLLLILDSLSACCDQWIHELRRFQTLVLHFVTMNASWTLPISDSCSAFCDNEWFHGLHWFPTLSFCMLWQWMIHGPCPAAVRLSFCTLRQWFHGLLCQFQTLVISAHLWQWMFTGLHWFQALFLSFFLSQRFFIALCSLHFEN